VGAVDQLVVDRKLVGGRGLLRQEQSGLPRAAAELLVCVRRLRQPHLWPENMRARREKKKKEKEREKREREIKEKMEKGKWKTKERKRKS
jgi:hypothetical protein